MKSSYEMELEQISITFTTEADLFMKQPINKFSEEKLMNLKKKFKQMKNAYSKIESQFITKGKTKIFEQRKKLQRYLTQLTKLENTLNLAIKKKDEKDKEQLIKFRVNPTQGNVKENQKKMRIRKLEHQNEAAANGIYGQATETQQITANTNIELYGQGRVLENIENDVGAAEEDLGMIDQLNRILNNRNLLTKLILVFMIVFLALADLGILLLKIF